MADITECNRWCYSGCWVLFSWGERALIAKFGVGFNILGIRMKIKTGGFKDGCSSRCARSASSSPPSLSTQPNISLMEEPQSPPIPFFELKDIRRSNGSLSSRIEKYWIGFLSEWPYLGQEAAQDFSLPSYADRLFHKFRASKSSFRNYVTLSITQMHVCIFLIYFG